jgi:hypothetical protein
MSRILTSSRIQNTDTQNLLLHSNDLTDAVWTKGLITPALNAGTDPFGGNTAISLTVPATNGSHQLSQTLTNVFNGELLTHSVYAKAGSCNWIFHRSTSGNFFQFFDVLNGVLGTTSGGAISSITSVGSGWYRCISVIPSSGVTVRLQTSTADNTIINLPTASIAMYVCRYQVNSGSYPSQYIGTTTTQVNPTLTVRKNNSSKTLQSGRIIIP